MAAQAAQTGASTSQHASGEALSSLYEDAKVHGNREAVAECVSKAEEAVAAGDFDKAVCNLQTSLHHIP